MHDFILIINELPVYKTCIYYDVKKLTKHVQLSVSIFGTIFFFHFHFVILYFIKY